MTSKEQARYRDYPCGQQRCDRCSMFRRPNDYILVEGEIASYCILVEGVIASCGWCEHWERKDA